MARRTAARRTPTLQTHGGLLPGFIQPQLTELVKEAPSGPDWLHELKFDGYRMHARLDHGAVRLLTRTGLDWTHKYPAIAEALMAVPASQAYLDGELCGVRPDGTKWGRNGQHRGKGGTANTGAAPGQRCPLDVRCSVALGCTLRSLSTHSETAARIWSGR
jgi:hypothetical protein